MIKKTFLQFYKKNDEGDNRISDQFWNPHRKNDKHNLVPKRRSNINKIQEAVNYKCISNPSLQFHKENDGGDKKENGEGNYKSDQWRFK